MTEIAHVAIVDDHRMFREGLALMLAAVPTIRVITHGSSAAEVLACSEARAIDIMILDVETHGPPARTTIAALRRSRPDIAVIVLTMHRDSALRRTLLTAGAADYVTKDTPGAELVRRISTVASATHQRAAQPESATGWDAPSVLSDRELEVLRLISAAHTNAEIAAELHLAVGTVKRHVFNAYRKLDVSSRVAAVAAARRLGLIT